MDRCSGSLELVTKLVSRHVVVTCFRVANQLQPSLLPTETAIDACRDSTCAPNPEFPSWTSSIASPRYLPLQIGLIRATWHGDLSAKHISIHPTV